MRAGLRTGTPPMLETTAHKLQYSSIPSNSTRARKVVGTVSPVTIMEDNDGTNNHPTTTMMMAEYPTIERQHNKLSSLFTKLAKYTRGSDRRQVLRTLHDSTLYPKLHTLRGVEGIEDIAAAEREVASERAVLNGVKFLQVRAGIASSTARAATTMPVDSYFLQTVREVCGHMCDMDGVTADPMALYGGLLLRLCRSASECDALETLTRWTCCTSGELVLLPIVRRHHTHHLRHATTAAAVANTTTNDVSTSSTVVTAPLQPPPLAEPLELELYVEGGNVHAKVSMKHEFGLYRRTDLESNNNGIATAAGTTTTTDTGKNITTTTATLIPWNQLIVLAQQEGLEALVRQQQQQAQQYNNQPKKNKTRSNNKAATNSRNDLMPATHELSAIQYTILAQLLRQQQQQIQAGQYHHHHQTHKVAGNIKPWVYIDATVVERINFGTGSSVRVLHVAVPEDKNSGYVKK